MEDCGDLSIDLPFRRRERAMLSFRRRKTLQKFSSIHPSIHNHFNQADQKIACFAELISQIMTGEDTAFRKANLRLFVETVIVGDAGATITGRKSALASAASMVGLPDTATDSAQFCVRVASRRGFEPLLPP